MVHMPVRYSYVLTPYDDLYSACDTLAFGSIDVLCSCIHFGYSFIFFLVGGDVLGVVGVYFGLKHRHLYTEGC
jgi:hypothetical protein